MPENDEPRVRRPTAFWLTLCGVIPVFDVLSVGPVIWSDAATVAGEARVRSFLDWYADIL